jgi:hypothetical protein
LLLFFQEKKRSLRRNLKVLILNFDKLGKQQKKTSERAGGPLCLGGVPYLPRAKIKAGAAPNPASSLERKEAKEL